MAAALGARAVAVAGDIHAQGAANLAWALATLRVDFGPELRRALAGLIAAKAGAGAFSPAQLSQVHQALLCARANRLWGEEGRALLSDAELARRCREAFVAWGTRPSSLEEEVAGCLRAMGAAFEREAVEPSTGYAIDFLVRTPGGPVALEVDGTRHFVGRAGQERGERRRQSGPTVLKARLLLWAGRRTAEVLHWEWDAAGRDGPGAQRQYLEGLLRPGQRGTSQVDSSICLKESTSAESQDCCCQCADNPCGFLWRGIQVAVDLEVPCENSASWSTVTDTNRASLCASSSKIVNEEIGV